MAKQVTIREVAVRAGVSSSTVSRVLNKRDTNHMRPETKARVLAVIEELEYIPAKAARSLRRQRTQVIGILLPDISNPFFSLLARGVESVAFEEGFSTLICDSNRSAEKESRYLEILLAEGVEGIVFIPVGDPDDAQIRRFLRRGIRIVAADRQVNRLPTVRAANEHGSAMLTNYVFRLGYRRIAYLAGPKSISSAQERLAGFKTEMERKGLTPVLVQHGPFSFESGFHLAKKLLVQQEVDGILAGDDLMAIGAIRAVEDLGLCVPRDLGVAGFDHIALADLVKPRLTTVEVPASRMGQEAARQLLRGGCQDVSLPVRFIKGASCAQRG